MFKLLKPYGPSQQLSPDKLQPALDYIGGYWETLTRYHPQSSDTLFGLPNPYIVPADQHGNFRFNEQYYWDSYFIAVGLVEAGQNKIAEGMLENLFYMFEHFKMIPNASRLYMTSRSQPPILTSFILLVRSSANKPDEWLKKAVAIAQEEYLNVWLGESHPHWRQVHRGLSRYYDINVLHDLAEAESGWDMTPRFGRKALDFLPIDLNCLLYKYETDFADIAEALSDPGSADMWRRRAQYRKQVVNELMWSQQRKYFFDYNFLDGKRGSVWSLAGFYAMWCGLASDEQAKQMVKNLSKFMCEGGLSTTSKTLIDMSIFGSIKTQWAYPNGWAPLHLIVCDGLARYGYETEARKVAEKWLVANLNWFAKHGEFLEKYNVAEPGKRPINGVYPTQVGFGWTNAVFLYLLRKYFSHSG